MKLLDLTWRVYRIPFRRPFVTAHGVLAVRIGAIVTARTDDGSTGYGEVAPLPEQSGVSLDAVLSLLPRLASELCGREMGDILSFLEYASEEGQFPSPLLCGLESALLDAHGRASGHSLAALLARGYPREESIPVSELRARIAVNVVIGGATTELAVEQARAAVDAGFACLKLKLADASYSVVERVASIRAAVGASIRLRLDANEGWSFEQARSLLARCAEYDIEYIEQPLPASDLQGMVHLRRLALVPIAADEAVSGLSSARRLLAAGAADVLILKPQLAGGLRACRRIIQDASRCGVACVITSTLEAGLGVAAALELVAASPEVTLPCGLATLDLLKNDLLRDGLLIERGHIKLPVGPGIGVELDEGALARYA